MSASTDGPRPRYLELADDLRKQIRTKQLKPGTKLPSGRKLAQQWGVAYMTVVKVLDLLQDEKLLVSSPRRGYWVPEQLPDEAAAGGQDPKTLEEALDVIADLNERLEQLERLERLEQQRSHDLEAEADPSRSAGVDPTG